MAAAIPLAIGAGLGAVQGDQERSEQRRFNKAAAESNRFADVTGNRTQMRSDAGNAFSGALKGASTFGGLAGAFGGAGGGAMSAADKAQGVADVGGQAFIQNKAPLSFGGGFVGGEPVQDVFQQQRQSSFQGLADNFGRS